MKYFNKNYRILLIGGDDMTIKVKKYKLNNTLKEADDMKTFAKSITDDIRSLGGVNAVRVDTLENSITVDYNEGQVSSDQIQEKLKAGNYVN